MKSLIAPLRFVLSHPLCKSARFSAIARFAGWQVTSRLRKGPSVHDWIEGSRFYVRAGEMGLTQNIYTGLHEFMDMAFLLHFLRADDLFLDVGANAGSYTILACAVKGARGYSFEPIPEAYKRLCQNVHLNRLDDRVKCLNVGVGKGKGEIRFTSSMDTGNHAVAAGEDAADAITVEVLPLDSVVGGESPTMMKIDVEGYEALVIEGAEETMRKPCLRAVIMEFGLANRYGFDENKILKWMHDLGFGTYSYDPFQRTLTSLQGNIRTGGNTLFIRDEAFVSERLRSALRVKVLGHSL